ncbi:hypothetical protein COLO4_20021 [Corchorus olitorius]|uniref:Endonuclease/exonuclease/phosphatase n=1 Tax=Corchorus olitorius TaxID=93759 RepID=A0A1R3J276_9ROSI|nr:hypothetical protein COLO4_20021 [Corchorus olitorius]
MYSARSSSIKNGKEKDEYYVEFPSEEENRSPDLQKEKAERKRKSLDLRRGLKVEWYKQTVEKVEQHCVTLEKVAVENRKKVITIREGSRKKNRSKLDSVKRNSHMKANMIDGAWLCIGDFNDVRFTYEKEGEFGGGYFFPDKVAAWINEDCGTWKVEAMRDWISENTIEAIQRIPLRAERCSDKIIWPFDSCGEYSAKSGYQILKKEEDMQNDVLQRIVLSGLALAKVYELTETKLAGLRSGFCKCSLKPQQLWRLKQELL